MDADAGASIRDVQDYAATATPGSYDQSRGTLDRSPLYPRRLRQLTCVN